MALLSGNAEAARIRPFGVALRLVGLVVEPDRKLGDKMLLSVVQTEWIDVDMQDSIRLLIDPDTKLIKQIQTFLRPEEIAQVDKDKTGTRYLVKLADGSRITARIDKEETGIRWNVSTTWTASSIRKLERLRRSYFSTSPLRTSLGSGISSIWRFRQGRVQPAAHGSPGQAGPRLPIDRRRQHGIEPEGPEIGPGRQGRPHRVLVDARSSLL